MNKYVLRDDLFRSLRGGSRRPAVSWSYLPGRGRAAYRGRENPGSRFRSVGFRVVFEFDSSDRALRGGSWFERTNLTRVAYRSGNYPDFRFNSVGFRVVFI